MKIPESWQKNIHIFQRRPVQTSNKQWEEIKGDVRWKVDKMLQGKELSLLLERKNSTGFSLRKASSWFNKSWQTSQQMSMSVWLWNTV